jgi:dTDP-glucose 4,6-dehydratase
MHTAPTTQDLEAILARGENYFRRLANERIFITGGTGFFGRWLLEALTHADKRLGLGLKITVLCRSPTIFLETNPRLATSEPLTWLRGDVRNFDMPAGTFGVVIHAATAASELLNRTQPMVMFDTIVNGTRRVLDFATSAKTHAMLLTSSGAVYGRQPPDVALLDETFTGSPDPTSTLSAYAEGKRVAEFVSAISDVPVKIARGFAFAGAHLPLDTHFAAGNFIRDAITTGQIKVKGDGTPFRSYLYAADLVIWLLAILLDGKSGRPYNVGSDQAISIRDLANTIAKMAGGREVRVFKIASGAPAERYVPSIERARQELDLDVWTPLPEAMRRTIAWARSALNTA